MHAERPSHRISLRVIRVVGEQSATRVGRRRQASFGRRRAYAAQCARMPPRWPHASRARARLPRTPRAVPRAAARRRRKYAPARASAPSPHAARRRPRQAAPGRQRARRGATAAGSGHRARARRADRPARAAWRIGTARKRTSLQDRDRLAVRAVERAVRRQRSARRAAITRVRANRSVRARPQQRDAADCAPGRRQSPRPARRRCVQQQLKRAVQESGRQRARRDAVGLRPARGEPRAEQRGCDAAGLDPGLGHRAEARP